MLHAWNHEIQVTGHRPVQSILCINCIYVAGSNALHAAETEHRSSKYSVCIWVHTQTWIMHRICIIKPHETTWPQLYYTVKKKNMCLCTALAENIKCRENKVRWKCRYMTLDTLIHKVMTMTGSWMMCMVGLCHSYHLALRFLPLLP